MNQQELTWKQWLAEVMPKRPQENMLLDSKRGEELIALALDFERQDFNWHRSDTDTFWLDLQLAIKYGLSDAEFLFILKQQPGIKNYTKHRAERKAFAEFQRSLQKLRVLFGKLEFKEGKYVEVEIK